MLNVKYGYIRCETYRMRAIRQLMSVKRSKQTSVEGMSEQKTDRGSESTKQNRYIEKTSKVYASECCSCGLSLCFTNLTLMVRGHMLKICPFSLETHCFGLHALSRLLVAFQSVVFGKPHA